MNLKRGSIYHINFPYTRDPRYPNGKGKYVLVLQEGKYFSRFDTVEILLITSKLRSGDRRYVTNVEIPRGSTLLPRISWVLCAQPYPVGKELFYNSECLGQLSPKKMDEVDVALYEGLCMGLHRDSNSCSGDEDDDFFLSDSEL